MSIFVVIGTRNLDGIAERIENIDGENYFYYQAKDDVWFVYAEETTRQLAKTLGLRDGSVGSGIVCSIDSYSGRAPKDLWEWLELHEAIDG